MKFNWSIKSFASKHGYVLMLFTACFMLMQSCNKQLDAPEPFPFEVSDISTSADNILINSSTPGDEAFTVSWPSFPNSMVVYKLVLANGDRRDSISIASGSTVKRLNHGELNAILVEKLGMVPLVKGNLEISIWATIPSKKISITSKTVQVKVVPGLVGATFASLWMVGDATSNGWNIDNPSPMKKDPTNAFQFKFNEIMTAGEFKIATVTGNWSGDFFMPLTNNPQLTDTHVQLVTGSKPDYKWKIPHTGAYKILLNISTVPSITITAFTPYKQIWLVGDAVPSGWNIDAPTPMTMTAGNPYEFSYTGTLKEGEFKISTTTGSWDTDFFMPPINGEGAAGKDVIFMQGGKVDNKWKISESGTYKIIFNQLYEAISIVKI